VLSDPVRLAIEDRDIASDDSQGQAPIVIEVWTR